MVFCGKPSKGCGECRSRKIRCDQALPACSQCTKGNRDCPGYRDQLALMFRDESQQVIRKARTGPATRKAKTSRKPGPGSRTASQSPGNSDTTTVTTTTSPDSAWSTVSGSFDLPDLADLDPEFLEQQMREQSLALQPSYQPNTDEAVCFFLGQNAWIGSFWSTVDGRQMLATPSHRAMMASLTCVGTAMLSRFRKSTRMKHAAEKEYGQALQLVTSAVRNEQQAKENATLAAVLTLAIFEVVCSRAPKDIDNWTNHITGAVALLELRGVEQLQNDHGLRLFLQLRYQIIISCLQKDRRVPPSVLQCAKVAMFLRPQSEAYGDCLITIMGRLSNIRADIKEKVLTDKKEILSAAYGIESELIAWLAALPQSFLYTTVEDTSSKPPSWGIQPYNNRYHIYEDLWICHTWNQYRVARIMVSDMILTYIRQLNVGMAISPELAAHRAQIRSSARQLAADICASVPYHFTDDAIRQATGQSGSLSLQMIPFEHGFVRGMILIWPLAIAGAVRHQSHSLHKWVLHCLQMIGSRMGIDQALAVMDILINGNGFYDTFVLSDENRDVDALVVDECSNDEN
ncbi:C6 finger domain protein [Aspergillus heteromorphus CBS 117.55]|uniref:C6 finger domain protein n=1 Tax=Aspergillus heteromorphus CBS 117.55 TaxID=1448321 RepID=A0A317WUE8_9EURO|nr:C6 finger domain protein [Aspergillus heteromorphus CBS 117.55]PWY90053.1 C6 finger domain protein [Aspergillus heteromorphus CBS 117.55]